MPCGAGEQYCGAANFCCDTSATCQDTDGNNQADACCPDGSEWSAGVHPAAKHLGAWLADCGRDPP